MDTLLLQTERHEDITEAVLMNDGTGQQHYTRRPRAVVSVEERRTAMSGKLDQVKGRIKEAAGEEVMIPRRFLGVNVWAVALLAAGVVASCGPLPTSQQPVQSSNPSVTYNFRSDQELLHANQNATTYCAQYQTAPRTANITDNSDGSKAVRFECVPTSLPVPPPANPSLSYSYRTDQELVQASQTAGAYCLKYGSQPMTSSIVSNPNGTKTVTFQCGLR